MTKRPTERKSTKREALFALLATFGLLAGFAFTAAAQDAPKAKDKDDKAAARDSIVESGYTRPGNVDDKFVKDGEILPAAFKGADLKKFKIMGGTVYFAVFKNTGMLEGDTFGTGMANIDNKFRTGRSYKDSYSPRYDTKAKYLYLYQIVNDRGLEPKIKAEEKKGEPVVGYAFGNPKAKVPMTEDIASFALKLLVDPRYITSWGHFSGAGFAANVADVDLNGKVVKNVVAGKDKVEELRLAFSYLPAIVSKIPDQSYSARARSYPLGELEIGFGVDRSTLNLEKSKAFQELKQVVDKGGDGNIGWVNFAKNLLLDAEQSALEPNYVQLMFMSKEEQAAAPVAAELEDDDITRAIFKVDFERVKNIKQGDRSVVFGFTTDLPPTESAIRIDSPKGAALSEGMKLASYFSNEGIGRAPAADGIGLVVGAADGALGLAMGTALGQASSPAPGGSSPAGFAGITGAAGLGGTPSLGGGGGGAVPAFSGEYSRPGGGIGGGGGFGGGTTGTGTGTTQGQAQGQNQNQNQTPTQSGNQSQTINFANTQTNQQAQAQAQAQLQLQLQEQSQHQRNNHGHGHDHNHHQGHVVPAPASLLLGLLGLPGLFFLRRRKTEA